MSLIKEIMFSWLVVAFRETLDLAEMEMEGMVALMLAVVALFVGAV